MTDSATIGFHSPENRTRFLSGLYSDLLETGIGYFFPGASLQRISRDAEHMPELLGAVPSGGQLEFEWMGSGYSLSAASKLSEHERRLIRSIGTVLSARYQLLTDETLAAQSFQLFRGLPEDRFVSAFLDPSPHASAEAIAAVPDRVADAIEVLRTSSMSTYAKPPHLDRCSSLRFHAGAVPRAAADPARRPALFPSTDHHSQLSPAMRWLANLGAG
jgi:hypothetical protein